MEKKVLAGAKLAGGNPENERVENDYYATNPEAVKMLLSKYDFFAQTILEPCVGGGHIANAINEFYKNKREITGLDLVDRGYPNTIVANFLTYETDKKIRRYHNQSTIFTCKRICRKRNGFINR